MNLQQPEGFWLGELEANSTLCSDYIAFMHWSGEIDSDLLNKCVNHLLATQLTDGGWSIYQGGPAEIDPWYGRWGVNYIYGTSHVLTGLRAIGIDTRTDWIQRGRHWLETYQNDDGGWGESCASYLNPEEKGKGKSTASQTAWAVMGLCAFPELDRASIRRGVDYLLGHQGSDGTWDENLQTGTGFPGVLYLRYDYYRKYWPLRALAIYSSCLKSRATHIKTERLYANDR